MTINSRVMPAYNSTQTVEFNGAINSSKIPQSTQEREIHLYKEKWMRGKEYLGTVPLDPSNCFKFNYSHPSKSKTQKISLEIFEKHRPFASKGLPGYCKLTPLGKTSLVLNNEKKQDAVITDEQIDNITHLDKPTGANKPSATYFTRLAKAGAPEVLKSGIISTFSKWMTVEKVQSLYNRFGAQYAFSEPTLPNLLNDLLNNICAIKYEKNGDQIKWCANWNDYQFDLEQSVPNVTVIAHKENDSLVLKSIEIQFRGEEKQIIIPDQVTPDELKWAIYMTRSSFALKGESENHLAEGHLLPGICAHAFLKFISKLNPLYDVVARYIENIDYINWLGGNGIIFGKGSVIELSALTERSVAELIIKFMQEKADYLNYHPTEPISSDHDRAIAGKIHYAALLEFFTAFVNDNWDKIVPFKEEIFQWSESMNEKLPSIPKIMPQRDSFSLEVEGRRLALCLTSLVNQTTFLHWSSHSRQGLLTHVDLASLSILKKGKDANGAPAKFGNTPVEAANLQLKISRTLLNFKAKRFVKYANSELLKRLEPLRDRYLSFPFNEMFVTTEI